MIDLLGRLYESLWRRIGGRPWTEIVRDDQKKSPLVYMLVFLFLGILLARLTGKYWWWILFGFFLGILCGHFWW